MLRSTAVDLFQWLFLFLYFSGQSQRFKEPQHSDIPCQFYNLNRNPVLLRIPTCNLPSDSCCVRESNSIKIVCPQRKTRHGCACCPEPPPLLQSDRFAQTENACANMPVHTVHTLPFPCIGTQRTLDVFTYGPAQCHRSVYIQAALHADELPGTLIRA